MISLVGWVRHHFSVAIVGSIDYSFEMDPFLKFEKPVGPEFADGKWFTFTTTFSPVVKGYLWGHTYLNSLGEQAGCRTARWARLPRIHRNVCFSLEVGLASIAYNGVHV
jgi:hypothetical protein